jgi:hypothetical protein
MAVPASETDEEVSTTRRGFRRTSQVFGAWGLLSIGWVQS